MKNLLILILAVSTFSVFRSFGSAKQIDLSSFNFFKVGMSVKEVTNKLGKPVYNKNKILEYKIAGDSIFRILLDDKNQNVISATVEFKKPQPISELDNDKKFSQYALEKTSSTTPTYFYALDDKTKIIWKVNINGMVTGASWVDHQKLKTKAGDNKKLQALYKEFINELNK
jgi:outer membrane protein assembly factor BamE (lipoprotein component of BamABCDE complex)